jgi:hypothetical protein
VFAVAGATTFYLLLTVSRKCILRWQADAERQRDEGLEEQERRRTNHLKYTLLAVHTAGLVSIVVGVAICARATYLCKNILVHHVIPKPIPTPDTSVAESSVAVINDTDVVQSVKVFQRLAHTQPKLF